jgi:hypothetical protein
MRKKQDRPSGFIITATILLLSACVSAPPTSNEHTDQNSFGILTTETLPVQRPIWISQTPERAEFLYFTGMAEADSESEARNNAVKNGFSAAAGFYSNLIQSETTDHSIFIENMGRTIAESTTYNDKTNSYTNTVISEVRAIEYHTETYHSRNTRVSYKVWALCRVPRQKAEEDRANFAKNISEQYTRLLNARYDTLSAALYSYSSVLAALKQNPLHQAVAYYDEPTGKVGLYDYCVVQSNIIAGSVSFDSLPASVLQRGMSLTRTVSLSSGMFSEIGAVPCRVIITENNNAASPEYLLEKNNSFTALIPTARLEAGNYTIQLELLLNSPALRQNPRGTFILEVRPVQAKIRFQGEALTQAEQKTLSQAVQEALQKYRVPLLAGYEFLLAFNIRTSTEPITGAKLLLCDISVSLNSAESVLFQSATGRIMEISRDHALELAADYIRDNKDFWTGAAEYNDQEH